MRASGLLLVLTAALWVALRTDEGMRAINSVDLAVVGALAEVRPGLLTDVSAGVVAATDRGLYPALAWTVLVVLALARRYQHLVASLTLLLLTPVLVAGARAALGRMRPAGVEIAASWEGYAHPSRPVAELALIATIAALVLAPPGRWRRRATMLGAGLVAVLVAARLHTAVDHPTDVLAGVALGVAVPVLGLRTMTPEEAFPVTYRRGVRAHLDVGGRRGEAIRAALRRQLGVEARRVEPFSLAGSTGSTPLRIEIADGVLFGKLYAAVHLRSDRWYKLARTVRYGRLEDERPFNSVRRLVQYEDHMLRVFRDAGVPVAEPRGIVEITPEREYLLVTEMLEEAAEISEAEVTGEVVDEALRLVRTLWDAGLAHRDIKPSNVLVAGERVWLVDVAFAEVRPSPWRQAVDLANMMLVLGLHVPATEVHERALQHFSPDEIAEAFAASRSVTVPAQLRAALRARGDDLAGTFRSMAPPRPPVAIQRWTLRRIGLTLGVLTLALLGLGLVAANLELAGLL